MKGKSCWVAMALVLLVGCSSQGTKYDPLPPAMGVPSAAAPRAAKQTELSDGPGITALINKNYNEDTTSCIDYNTGASRGYYFCTGVLLRTTDNGNFNPWEASPTALALKGTSFSWIRHDLNTRGFFKRAGFILLSSADTLAEAVPGVTDLHVGNEQQDPAVTCVYPFDAWTTRTMNRPYGGCNYEGVPGGVGYPTWAPWGICDKKLGYTTSAQWDWDFNHHAQVNYNQCSWSSDNAQGWRNSITSHNNFPAQSYWNEVMIKNWGGTESVGFVNEAMRLWTVAFFYDAAKDGSLSDAQAFQQKMANTGKRVPILRLDFSAPAAQRFAFRSADQVTTAYP